VHHADGGVTRYHHDEDHRPCGITAPNGAHTAWRQDRLGRCSWITDALGATTTYEYPPGGYPAEPGEPPRAHVHTQPERSVCVDGSTCPGWMHIMLAKKLS
jgi:YD repeat-containing protein